MPASRPLGPSATCSTSGGPGSEVKMTSLCSASAFGVSAHTAPAARWRSAAARRMSCTTSSCPAFCRFAAMLAPIVPSPIKPIFICVSRIREPLSRTAGEGAERSEAGEGGATKDPHPPVAGATGPSLSRDAGEGLYALPLLAHVLGALRRGHRRRPAGIESEMGDDLADLILGDAVVEGAIEMADQLPLAAERDQRRDDDQAAVALLQARAFPNLAEQPLLAVIDQVGNDV